MINVLKPWSKSVLLPFGETEAASATDAATQIKMFVSVIFSNYSHNCK